MKLVHPDLHFQIEWTEGVIPVFLIESAVQWRNIQKELFLQSQGIEGGWILSDDDKEIKFSKSVEMISNPIQLEENQKRVMNAFLQSLRQKAMSEQYWKRSQELNASIQKFFADLEIEYSFAYNINAEIDIPALAKAMEIHFEYEYENDLERMLQYCILIKDMLGTRLFIFWNLHHYFNKQELGLFYQEVIIRKWRVLLMETSLKSRMDMEKYYIIDQDNCEIY